MTRTALALVVIAVIAAAGSPARADEPPFHIGARPAWFIMGGFSGGATVAGDTRGAFAGGELSLSRINRGRFAGLYADAYYDFGVAATYATVGPELGFSLRDPQTVPVKHLPLSLGVDFGAAFRFAGDTEVGVTARLSLIVLGSVSLFARYSYFDSAADDHVLQLGVSIKFPLLSPFGAAVRGVP